MSLVTYTLTAYIYDSDGDPIQDADLRAILSQVEVDDGYVVQRRVHVTTDAQGLATMDLWPNTRGTGTSHYIVWAIDKDGRGLFEVTLKMPAHDANLSVEAGAPIPDVTPSQDLLVQIQSMYADIIAARDSARTWKDLAKGWAIEIPAKVNSVDYSSKNWAVGATIASAKRWATETASAVAGGLYSAKEWAIGTLMRGQAGGGSSKDWANYTGGSVDDIEYSSKEWAQGSAAASAKRWSEEAHNTPVEPGEYSSYHWATESENSATAAAASATGASNSENQAAGSASAAASSASAAQSSETAAAGSESAAASSASAAQSSETAAGLSETAAANSATSAQQSSIQAGNAATSAESARDKAKDWAENPEGSPVEPGEFSAYHWAQKAQAAVTGQLIYMGSWDASTGSYPVSPAKGQYYKVSVAGTVSGTSYAVGDSIIYNGSGWDKIDNTDQVTSVVGHVGAITKAQIKSALETIASKFKIDVDTVDGEHAADLHKAANITGTLPVAHGGTGGTTAAAARTGLGLKSAATKDHGTGAGDVPLNSDLSSAAYVDTGTGAGDVPLNSDLSSAAFVDHGTGAGDVPTITDADARYAQLTGGGDANFTAMPQVGGVAVVESGSNANGSYTKWADGTMMQKFSVSFVPKNISPNSRTSITPNLPQTFVGSSYGTSVGRVSTNTKEISMIIRTAKYLSGSVSLQSLLGAWNTSQTYHITIMAWGKWK